MQSSLHYFLIAADPLPRLWPVSSSERSFAFVRGADGLSPVERLLRAIHATSPDASVTLITSQPMLQDAQCALQEAFISRHKTILVDARTSFATLTTLAASLTAKQNEAAKLIILPGNMLASSEKRLSDTMQTLAEFDDQNGMHIGTLAAQHSAEEAHDKATVFAASMNGRADWMPVENAQIEQKGSPEDALAGKSAVSFIGPIVVQARCLLEIVSQAAPLITQACTNSIAMAKELSSEVLVPKSSFLALLGETRLDWILQKHIERVRVLPVDEASISAAFGWENRLALELSATGMVNRSVSMAGYKNAQRIDFDGQTLLLNPGHEAEVCFPSQSASIVQDADRAIFSPIYRLLTFGEESEAWLLDLPGDTRTQRECHFTRTEKLTVLNGRITVRIENEVFKLSAGQQVNISPGMAHTLENHAQESSRILEMRIGKILDDDDRLYVPDATLYKSTAA